MNISQSTTEEFWNRKYKNHRLIYGKDPSKSAMQCARLITSRKNSEGNKVSLLEIGGGYGRNARYLASFGVEASVIDFSSEAIELGRRYVAEYGQKINFLKGDVRELAELLTSQKYDIVFSNFCLHIFSEDERKKIYNGIEQVLKPDGLFVGSFLSINDTDYSDDKQISPRTKIIRGKPQHFFTIPEIKRELKDFLEVVSIKERNDPEKIIDSTRNTSYFFVVAKKGD